MISRLLPILAFAVAILIFFLYVNPMYSGSIATTQAAIASDNQALAAAASYTAKENQLITAENQIDPTALARLTTFLPDSSDDVGLILDLDALAASDGLSLTSVDVADQSQPDASTDTTDSTDASGGSATGATTPYASLDLTIAATGTYASFRSFLGSIESSERLLDVEDLTVKGSNTGVYTYAMTLQLYWLQ